MKNRFSKIVILLIFSISLTLGSTTATAQCPMCKIGAESNLQAGGTAAKGLNSGILYMFATPYLVVGSIAFLWWYNRRREGEEDLITKGELES